MRFSRRAIGFGVMTAFMAVFFLPAGGSAGPTGTLGGHLVRSARIQRIGSFAEKQAVLAGAGNPNRPVLGATGSIAGKVYGLALSDIGSAYVEAWKADSILTEGDKGLAMVDSNFTYRIDNLSPGAFTVMVWADGYDVQYYNGASDAANAVPVRVVGNQVTNGIDFRLAKPVPGTGSIAGSVRDEKDGKPVGGAVVTVHSSDLSSQPYRYGKAQTDSSGRYAVTGLKSGTYFAQVTADGYVWELYDGAEDVRHATPIMVTEPQAASGIDFRIERGGILSGRVADASGKPIAKAMVMADHGRKDSVSIDPSSSDFFSTTPYAGTTDPAGDYVIPNVKKGKYIVQAMVWLEWETVSRWYRDAETPLDADSVEVRSGETTSGIDFRLKLSTQAGSISGRVFDRDGRPIEQAGIYVQAQTGGGWAGSAWRYAWTDTSGFYRVDKLAPGAYTVSCWAHIGWLSAYRWWPDAETIEKARTITVAADSTVQAVDVRLPIKRESGSIEGVVRSSTGRSLTNASVRLQSFPVTAGGGKASIWAYANTDSLGRYAIRQLPAGTYAAHASCWENDSFGQEWYRGKSGEETADPLVLAEGQGMGGIDFSLGIKPLYGTVAGIVTDSLAKKPIPGAYVEITPLHHGFGFRPIMAWNFNTVADEKGKYVFERLMAGQYRIAVYANGGFAYYKNAPVAAMADTVSLEGGQTIRADMTLVLRNDGSAGISGTVTSDWGWTFDDSSKVSPPPSILSVPVLPKGSPVFPAVVMARPAVTVLSYPESERFYTALTDSGGCYTLRGLPPGEYYVYGYAPYHMLEYYDNALDPAKATLVRLDKETSVPGIDFVLSPMLFYYRNMEPGMKTDENANTLSGKVLDASGKAIEGAAVYLLNDRGQPLAFVQTGADGSYAFNGIQPGHYYIQASKLGYATQVNGMADGFSQTVPMAILDGRNEVNFTLRAGQTTGVRRPTGNGPAGIRLLGCYPNPFNQEAQIVFALSERAQVSLRIFNMRGQEIVVLCDRMLDAGQHAMHWRGTDRSGALLPSGLYVYHVQAAKTARTGKVALLR